MIRIVSEDGYDVPTTFLLKGKIKRRDYDNDFQTWVNNYYEREHFHD